LGRGRGKGSGEERQARGRGGRQCTAVADGRDHFQPRASANWTSARRRLHRAGMSSARSVGWAHPDAVGPAALPCRKPFGGCESGFWRPSDCGNRIRSPAGMAGWGVSNWLPYPTPPGYADAFPANVDSARKHVITTPPLADPGRDDQTRPPIVTLLTRQFLGFCDTSRLRCG